MRFAELAVDLRARVAAPFCAEARRLAVERPVDLLRADDEVERAVLRLAPPLLDAVLVRRLVVRRRVPPLRRSLGRDLVAHDLGHQLVQLAGEERLHALLLAAELLGQPGGLLVVELAGDGLDHVVMRDLLGLVPVGVTDVAQHVVGLAGAAQQLDGALRHRDRAVGEVGGGAGRLGQRRRAREVRSDLGLAAERLDPLLQAAGLTLGHLEVILEALLEALVVLGTRDQNRQVLLELLLFAERLVEVLDEDGITGGGFCRRHMTLAFPLGWDGNGLDSTTPRWA